MAMGSNFVGPRKPSNSGFWGSIGGSLQKGVGDVFSKVLPVWAAQELQVQTQDQLSNPLYNPNTASPRINDGLTTSGGSPAVQSGQAVRTGLLFDNINVSGAALLGLAIAVVAVVVVARS